MQTKLNFDTNITNFVSNVKGFSKKFLVYYPTLRQLTGSIKSAIMLMHLVYWSKYANESGWFYRNIKDVELDTGLTRREQETAIKRLVKLGFIEYMVGNNEVPKRRYFKVNLNAIYIKLLELKKKKKLNKNKNRNKNKLNKKQKVNKNNYKLKTNIQKFSTFSTSQTSPLCTKCAQGNSVLSTKFSTAKTSLNKASQEFSTTSQITQNRPIIIQKDKNNINKNIKNIKINKNKNKKINNNTVRTDNFSLLYAHFVHKGTKVSISPKVFESNPPPSNKEGGGKDMAEIRKCIGFIVSYWSNIDKQNFEEKTVRLPYITSTEQIKVSLLLETLLSRSEEPQALTNKICEAIKWYSIFLGKIKEKPFLYKTPPNFTLLEFIRFRNYEHFYTKEKMKAMLARYLKKDTNSGLINVDNAVFRAVLSGSRVGKPVSLGEIVKAQFEVEKLMGGGKNGNGTKH